MSPRTLNNVDYFKNQLKFNETTSFWIHFIHNFDGIQFIKRINVITHRIKNKII